MNIKEQMFREGLSRRGKPQPALEERVAEVFKIVDLFNSRAETIKSNKALSVHGKKEEMAKLLGNGGGYFALIDGVKAKLEPARKHLAGRRAALMPKQPDPTDVVAEMRRAEIRAHIRNLPIGDKTAMLGSKDPLIVEAITSVPAMLSGIPEDRHAFMINNYIETNHAAELREIEMLESQVAEVDAAIQVARQDIEFSSQLDPADLRQIAASSQRAA